MLTNNFKDFIFKLQIKINRKQQNGEVNGIKGWFGLNYGCLVFRRIGYTKVIRSYRLGLT